MHEYTHLLCWITWEQTQMLKKKTWLIYKELLKSPCMRGPSLTPPLLKPQKSLEFSWKHPSGVFLDSLRNTLCPRPCSDRPSGIIGGCFNSKSSLQSRRQRSITLPGAWDVSKNPAFPADSMWKNSIVGRHFREKNRAPALLWGWFYSCLDCL